MPGEATGTVAVCGATGRQGGAVARRLLAQGWNVRALTRKPRGRPAGALAALGAEVVQADMGDPGTLARAFAGADGVYCVQNGIAAGFDAEVAQARNVAQAAAAAGVAHFVYGSAGPGHDGTGVPSWESKVVIEEHIRTLDLPCTILRPTAFMELMTDPAFYPAVGTWRLWLKLTGDDRAIPWLAVEDLGSIAAIVFANPDQYRGRELTLAADLRSLGECRSLYREIMGRKPRAVPMPMWLFDRFTRKDPTAMWRWLRTQRVDVDPAATRAILPSALTVREWLTAIRDRRRSRPEQEGG
jgi:uncharacterized protein YbjT (DUF2867 family)